MVATRLTFALRAPAFRNTASVQRIAAVRSFQSCRALAVGKESALGNEDRPDEIEHHKQDQLQKQKEGKGHWKDELASDSESIVKADRGDIGNTKDTIKQLQEETAKLAQDDKEGEIKK